jgi:carbon-monoxide dehydrogenase iron sulfur subunit
MACPFGVLRFHQDASAPPNKSVAVKCDNCEQRQDQGLIPACVEMCKAGALTFEEMDDALKRKTDQVSHSVIEGGEAPYGEPATYSLLKKAKKAQSELVRR